MTSELNTNATGTDIEIEDTYTFTGIEVDPTTGEHIDCGQPEPVVEFTFKPFISLYERLNAITDPREYQLVVIQAFAESSIALADSIENENLKMARLGYYDYISLALEDIHATRAMHESLLSQMDRITDMMASIRKWDTAKICTDFRHSQALFLRACDSIIAEMHELEGFAMRTYLRHRNK